MSLYNQGMYACFPMDFDALSSLWFPPWSSCFEACRLRVVSEVSKFAGLNSLLWSIQLENIAKVFLEKVSLPKFLITTACNSYADFFQHNTIYQGHGYVFCSMIRILKVESKTFCGRDGTRTVSQENSFARTQGW